MARAGDHRVDSGASGFVDRWGWFLVAFVAITAVTWLADVFTVRLRRVRGRGFLTGYEV